MVTTKNPQKSQDEVQVSQFKITNSVIASIFGVLIIGIFVIFQNNIDVRLTNMKEDISENKTLLKEIQKSLQNHSLNHHYKSETYLPNLSWMQDKKSVIEEKHSIK